MFKAVSINVVTKQTDSGKEVKLDCRAFDSTLGDSEAFLNEVYTSEEEAQKALDNFLKSWYNVA